MTKEEIEKRIKDGQEHLTKRREDQKKKIADRKEGIAFVHENKIKLMTTDVNYSNTFLVLGAIKEDVKDNVTVYRCGYAVCSPNDSFSNKVAKGLVGRRLKNKCPVFSFVIGVTNKPTEKEVLHIARCWLKMASLSEDKNIPSRLIRVFKSDVNHPVFPDDNLKYIGE